MLERRPVWGALVLCAAGLTPNAVAQGDVDPLLAKARDGNRAALAAIETMECKYECVPWGDTTLEQAKANFGPLLAPVSYWRSGGVYRVREPGEEPEPRDYIVRDGRMLTLGWSYEATGARRTLLLTAVSPHDVVGGDLSRHLLFCHWGKLVPSGVPFHDIVDQPHVVHTAQHPNVVSKEIYVEMTHAGGRLELWFDPKVNYLVRKCVTVPAADSTFRWEREVVTFAEPAPRVFVPTTIEHRSSVRGELRAVVRTVLSDVKVNHRLADDALRLPGIAGMECRDYIRKVAYTVDADGRQVGPDGPFKEPESFRRIEERTGPAISRREAAVFAAALLIGTGIALVLMRLLSKRSTNSRDDAPVPP